jgi:hypothetical protein
MTEVKEVDLADDDAATVATDDKLWTQPAFNVLQSTEMRVLVRICQAKDFREIMPPLPSSNIKAAPFAID